MTVSVLWLILTVAWVGLQCVFVVFPDHTHLLYCNHLEVRAVCFTLIAVVSWARCGVLDCIDS